MSEGFNNFRDTVSNQFQQLVSCVSIHLHLTILILWLPKSVINLSAIQIKLAF